MGAVATVVCGWGVAQWPSLLPTSVTVQEPAAPSGTLVSVIVVTVIAALVVFPSLGRLDVLDQRGALEPDRSTGN